jgi:hypothetical protein
MMPAIPEANRRPPAWIIFLLLIPFLLAALIVYGMLVLLVHIILWLIWGPLRRNVLFVYSSSPVWEEYIEQNFLPRLPTSALVLNWSERRSWNRLTLGYLAFRFFGGSREFNPMAVIVRPFRWAKCFRFWKPFRDFNHGNAAALRALEKAFFECVDS